MWEKIKSTALIIVRGTFSSWHGLLGMTMICVSLYFSIGLFNGIASIQNYFRNRIALGKADARIEALQNQLDAETLHIKLIQTHSPDFISEMARRHLNLGDPRLLILKK
jgi:cell division protein FtsB